ncbi:MAG: transglycosylase family protein [Staphylococcus equorum]|uniref:transglycosylase family protein n=1 Tax=Staphylococcus TaxID=1279 RepID=UPI000852ACE3|nr:transglycosylase family protein [Staphylococcus equorum]MDG0823241.1 transglycosylase family protein [Staphylococcus equorum]MDG0836937.1 transglycosylase family protein [Staphylococcus equorum]MDK9871528.1 transglycosylase family protein [Staphylococcus equorum]MDK9877903.1 transglycosylase family protein [Staphylococcus equorum]MDN5828831.1 transglycosylase family protein [Staphylococcus equorum]
MKKTVIASTLAVGLGVTGAAAGNSADASEQNVDQAQLAQQAQSNPEQLNEAPVQDGSYDIDFNHNGTDYSFESDGTNFSWSFGGGSTEGSTEAPAQQEAPAEQAAEPAQQSEPAEQAAEPAQQEAPKTETTQQPQQESTSKESSSSEASSGSSVNVNSHLQTIAQRESGGDITAINASSGAAGKYQFLQSTWDSVAPAAYQGVSPAEAPESVQDAAAVELYNTAGASQWVTA